MHISVNVCVDASLSHDDYTNTQTRFMILQNSCGFVRTCIFAHSDAYFITNNYIILLIQLNNIFYIATCYYVLSSVWSSGVDTIRLKNKKSCISLDSNIIWKGFKMFVSTQQNVMVFGPRIFR